MTALIAVILFCISAIEERTEGKTERVAASVGKKVEKRIEVLVKDDGAQGQWQDFGSVETPRTQL